MILAIGMPDLRSRVNLIALALYAQARGAFWRITATLVGNLWRVSASFMKTQPMLTQFVVQGLARQAEGFSEAAQRIVRSIEFRRDQGALERLDLVAETARHG